MLTLIIVLAIAGILLVIFELVIPGGILGVIGAGCLVATVVLTFVQYGPGWGIASAGLLAVFGFLMIWVWMKYFHRLPFTRKLVLQGEVGKDEELVEKQSLVGSTGKCLTDIRPSGRALIDGEKLDVISETGVIDKDSEIEVVDTRGPSVIVRALPREEDRD